MNRNQLKYLVIAAMLIDHIAWMCVPTASVAGQAMHFIGRLTAPVMAYFLAEGYCHTRNVRKYALRLGVFALLSWAPFLYFEQGMLPVRMVEGTVAVNPATGVIYTLFLGLLAIWLWDKGKCPKWCKVAGVIGLCLLSVIGDWLFLTVLWALFFYVYREQTRKKWVAYSIIGLLSVLIMLLANSPWWSSLFMLGVFAVPFLIQYVYNGQPGSKNAFHKWFFYLFYPLHLLLLGVIRWNLF